MKSVPVPTSSSRKDSARKASRRAPARKRAENPAIETTRERILTAAARLFAERGFTAASMPAIAALSGITAGAIYRHFASKADLLLEVVKRALRALPISLEGNGADNDVAMLPEVAARYTDPALKLLRQLSLEVHAAASRDQEVHALLYDYDEQAIRRIYEVIETARRARKLSLDRDLEFTARAVVVFIMGLNHMDTLYPHLVGDRAWREFVAAHVAALLGLGAR